MREAWDGGILGAGVLRLRLERCRAAAMLAPRAATGGWRRNRVSADSGTCASFMPWRTDPRSGRRTLFPHAYSDEQTEVSSVEP